MKWLSEYSSLKKSCAKESPLFPASVTAGDEGGREGGRERELGRKGWNKDERVQKAPLMSPPAQKALFPAPIITTKATRSSPATALPQEAGHDHSNQMWPTTLLTAMSALMSRIMFWFRALRALGRLRVTSRSAPPLSRSPSSLHRTSGWDGRRRTLGQQQAGGKDVGAACGSYDWAWRCGTGSGYVAVAEHWPLAEMRDDMA